MTFEDLQKANESIMTTTLEHKNNKTGKTEKNEYAPVNQRIKAFRMVYPNGAIQTDIKSMNNGVVVMTAEVYDENGKLIGTGTAYEKESNGYINKTSYIENCETSAVGRALGMCGFGIDTSIASAEEMETALTEQAKEEHDEGLLKEAKRNTIEGICKKHRIDPVSMCESNGLKWDKMTEENLQWMLDSLMANFGDDA